MINFYKRNRTNFIINHITRIKTFLLIFFIASSAKAQLYVSSDISRDFIWNNSNEQWDLFRDDRSAILFEFNTEWTIIKQISDTGKYSYFIQSTKEDKNEGRDQMIIEILTDDGEDWTVLFDFKNNVISFISEEYETKKSYTIKSMWKKEP